MIKLFWSISRDRKKQWRVRAKARNGRIVFASSEGYATERAALRNAKLFGAPFQMLKLNGEGTSWSQ